MNFSFLKDAHPAVKLVFTAFLVLTSALILGVLGLLLGMLFFDSFSMAAFSDFQNPENLGLLKYFQIVLSIGIFVVPPFLAGLLFYGNSLIYLKLNIAPSILVSILIVGISFISMPVINFLVEFNSAMVLPDWLSGIEEAMRQSEAQAQQLMELFLRGNTWDILLVNMLMIAIVPALGEELLFRGLIQRLFTEWSGNKHFGIWFAAILFSALHMQFYGFIPRMLLGVFFGYLFVWSGSLWLPIIGHFINNGVAVIAYFIAQRQNIDIEISEIGIGEQESSLLISSIVLSAALLSMVYFYLKKENLAQAESEK